MARDASTQPGYAEAIVAATLDAACNLLRTRAQRRRRPWLLGVSGLQGTGKSTFARQLAASAQTRGLRVQVLVLDDFYFGRRERQRLARDVHPLLVTRGVPGTHDLDLLTRTLHDLAHASARNPAWIPRFSKARDTRLPRSHWRRVEQVPRMILLEGWCVGVPAQPARALVRPLNALERNEDRDGRWRRWVNAQLGGAYAVLWRRLDLLVLLQAPGFAIVERWRGEPERRLRARGAPAAMDAAALRHFLMHYERLSRHALRSLPARADIRIDLAADHRVRAIAGVRLPARNQHGVVATGRAAGRLSVRLPRSPRVASR